MTLSTAYLASKKQGKAELCPFETDRRQRPSFLVFVLFEDTEQVDGCGLASKDCVFWLSYERWLTYFFLS